ncbi:alanine racemase [Marinactinospora rubrisoli]|uniref:Multifunctional fusion protein n=1 Tax=Marinactinospora rubrisoli TaxID=2715399 RepID=A0ABW2KK82_9ACTN
MSTPTLTVDLAAVAHNARLFAALSPGFMAVVKADAFNHGAPHVARTALANGAGRLGVTSVREAVDLRGQGATAPMLSWLNPPGTDYTEAIGRDVELAVGDLDQLDAVADAARRAGRAAGVHLFVDTGMSRDGAPIDQWAGLVARARSWERRGAVRIIGVMSHLACAEEPAHPANEAAVRLFERAVSVVHAAGATSVVRHLAASAATLDIPRTRFDMTRIGAGLYGIDPAGGHGLRRAMTLAAPVVMVRDVAPGTPVGYGHTHLTRTRTRLALVPLGYADGIPRTAADRAEVMVHGRRRPVVGAVSMDQIVVDVGDLPVAAGDPVTVFGPGDAGEPTTGDWARWCGTNEHELMTGVGPRVERIIREPQAAPPTDPRDAARDPGVRTPPVRTSPDQKETGDPMPGTDERVHVIVVCGGTGAEHDVSLSSAESILEHLDSAVYRATRLIIGRDGRWLDGDGEVLPGLAEAVAVLDSADVVFPIIHGTLGEDGTLSALLDLCSAPYVGPNVRAGAVSMDKHLTKLLARDLGVRVAPGILLDTEDPDVLDTLPGDLRAPVFVKPNQEGSSFGVSRVTDLAELDKAVAHAAEFDRHVLVEQEVQGREIDIAVLDNPDGSLTVSAPLEIRVGSAAEFFDTESKYVAGNAEFLVPAPIPEEWTGRLRQASLRLYRLLGCTGTARFDYFVDDQGEPVLNEINTVPGLTARSQVPRMFQALGTSYSELLDILIRTAMTRAEHVPVARAR